MDHPHQQYSYLPFPYADPSQTAGQFEGRFQLRPVSADQIFGEKPESADDSQLYDVFFVLNQTSGVGVVHRTNRRSDESLVCDTLLDVNFSRIR